jgi:hypothetical protein
MNKKHCDLCDQVIEGDYYTLGRHVFQKGDFHYREICLDCIKKLLSDEEIQDDEM